MRKIYFLLLCFIWTARVYAQSEYTTSVTFPANFQVGDYIEFLRVSPINAGASGYYEVSVSYTRGNIAAAATHLASISHSNPPLWREVGRINNNPYTAAGNYNFTIDCNTEYANPRFRVRTVNTYGISEAITVNIKVRSINANYSWTALSATGRDLTVSKFLPMTNEWSLYVGNDFSYDGANLAIKAIENGNVGIGTSTPDQKLTVNGTIHSKEVKVDLGVPAPDYVFESDYKLASLSEIKNYIDKNHHLPEIPSADQMAKGGINLSEMNMKLLKKVEELTLHLIEQQKQLQQSNKKLAQYKRQQIQKFTAIEKRLSKQLPKL